MATAEVPDADESTRKSRRRRVSRGRRAWLFLRDILIIVLIAVLVSWLIKTFVVRSFYIPSSSMEMTLQVQDRILVDELTPDSTATTAVTSWFSGTRAVGFPSSRRWSSHPSSRAWTGF